MKKFFSYAILLFLAAMYMAGCGSGSNTKTAEAVPMTVDSLLAVAGDRIGDSVVVEGFCKTICKKCGRKLFLTGDDSTKTLRIESGESIGMFDAGAVHAIVRVEGRIMEQRIDEDYLQQWADQAAERCESAAAAEQETAQADFGRLQTRLDKYRARIAERPQKVGKIDRSVYYIEADGYEIQEVCPNAKSCPTSGAGAVRCTATCHSFSGGSC